MSTSVQSATAVARCPAEGMVLDQHPDAQFHAVNGALVTEENRHQLMVAVTRCGLRCSNCTRATGVDAPTGAG